VAGATDQDIFGAEACQSVFRFTDGVPRLINVLCDSALHIAFARASPQVSAADVAAAAQEPVWVDAVARARAPAGSTPAAEPAASVQAPPVEVPAVSPGASLRVSLRGKPVAVLPLPEGRFTIGRASDNDMQLESQVVSRHHCLITTAESVATIEDLGSVNGLMVNGKATKRQALAHGDQIQVGEHLLVYETAGSKSITV